MHNSYEMSNSELVSQKHIMQIAYTDMVHSGEFRNLERGFSHWRVKRTQTFWVAMPTSSHVNTFMTTRNYYHSQLVSCLKQLEVQTEYLEATLGPSQTSGDQ